MAKFFRTYSILLAFVSSLFLYGCSNIKDINVLSAEIKSVSVRGLSSIEAAASITVDNPGKDIYIESAEGIIYRDGESIGKVTISPAFFRGRSVSDEIVNGTLALTSISPMSMLLSGNRLDINDFTADLHIRARLGKGRTRALSFKNIPIKTLIRTINRKTI